MSQATTVLRESQLSVANGVAHFSHQRPSARNALSMELRADYQDMLAQVESDRGIRALVISGSGGSFCAGGDLKSLQALRNAEDPEARSPDAMRRRLQAGHVWMERLRSLEVPVIAAVDGPAVGAGFSIALAADFVLASTRAVFCMSFAKVGLVPDLGAFYFLPRVVGMARAKELALTARRVGAQEARDLGIVLAIHAPEDLEAQALRMAGRLAAGPREALGLTKNLFNRSFETPYATLAEMESQAQAVASAAPFHAQAIDAFLGGRPAAYDWDRQDA
ncbi:enoyl-CoA hydratase/isomerase family protein [Variovorax sp. OV329]|uniref:enoyl-CoA hydratase/isomerase family protein n=1 Tax=Variovorax sp. OV329 TaxID=1882825 RepID=UPI0008E350AE|nr:enoyl-CoA hydratase/isomerase family protein [Variovorax sp. OV329]SFN02627.1 Enoyl-CoA hydratase [Variovorax sp. OV329]